jgi:3-methyladenine DNA glycosylase AlkC
MRDAWKHSKTPQVKAVSAQSLKAVIEKHAALLAQMGRNEEAAALRREASEI